MKSVAGFVMQFVLTYGIRDKERFHRHASAFLEDFAFEEATKEKLINFLYEFCLDLSTYLRETSIAKQAAQDSMAGMEKRMDDLMARFEEISKGEKPSTNPQ